MTENAKITVLLPVKDTNARHLALALESIRRQTFEKWVCLIINDGGALPIEILQVIDGDGRFQLIQNSKSSNLAAALNVGLKLVETPFVARMDADDIAGLSRFDRQISVFEEKPELFLVGSSLLLIDEAGAYIGELQYPSTYSEIKQQLMYRNPLAHPSLMIRMSLFERVGYYDETYSQCEDLELWLRVVAHDLPCLNIEEPLMEYRVGSSYLRSRRNWLFNLRARLSHFRLNHVSDWIGVAIAAVKLIAPDQILRKLFDLLKSKV
jgi:glycosyltransferase involved in cell wall biosynthesis